MASLTASRPANDVRGVAFAPSTPAAADLAPYSLGPFIAVSEESLVRLGVVAAGVQVARLVAIKQLKPALIRQQSYRARFEQEIRIHARVRHPNVVELVDVVESRGESWLVMEHVDGVSFVTLGAHRRAAGLPLEPELAAGIIAPVLRALHAVHETKDDAGFPLGIVHCAVSPRHVMVTRDGQVKLLDFGEARAVGARSAPAPRGLPGRTGYLSPELLLGQQVDRRSDVFAAGVMLWEALAGRPLFQEPGVSEAEIVLRVLRAPIPELRKLRPGIPKTLDAVVHRALQRDPKKRFATANEFLLALEAASSPASPCHLAAFVAELGGGHFEMTRQALAAVRRPLPTLPDVPRARDALGADGPTAVIAGQSNRVDTLGPASAEAVAPGQPPSRSQRRLLTVALLAAASVVALLIAVREYASRSSVGSPALEPTLTAEVLRVALAPRARFAFSSEPPLAKPVPVEALPLSEPPCAKPRAACAARRQHGHGQRPRAVAAPRARSAQPGSCSPPTFVGEDGIRHFKEHCL